MNFDGNLLLMKHELYNWIAGNFISHVGHCSFKSSTITPSLAFITKLILLTTAVNFMNLLILPV